MLKFAIILFFISGVVFAEEDVCKYLKYCRGSTRGSSQSLPSSSSAGNLNPSNISSVKGFGIETIYQPNNPLSFDIVTGNGKIGALISPSLENSFFGNRSIEIDDLFLIRRNNKTQYKNNKINLGIGLNLIDKKNIALGVGYSVKRNPDIKKLNSGVGASIKLFILNFGAYIYQDDVKINLGNYINPYTYTNYSTIYGSSSYQEKFSVKTFTAGATISNLSLDFGVIKTKYNFYTDNTLIYLYSGSYSFKSFLFNYAIRKENSSNLDVINGSLTKVRNKTENYYSAEYLMNHTIVMGLHYNYFLLQELSASLTFFF